MERILDEIIKKQANKKNKGYSLTNSEYFIKLINLKLSHKEVCELTNLKYNTVQSWRRRNIPEDIYKKYFIVKERYTEKEIIKLKEGKINELNRSSISIFFKCKKLNIDRSYLKFKQSNFDNKEINSNAFNKNKDYTLKEKELILSNKYNAKELACMLGRTVASIYSFRNNNKNI